jgi:hypothetical protein
MSAVDAMCLLASRARLRAAVEELQMLLMMVEMLPQNTSVEQSL